MSNEQYKISIVAAKILKGTDKNGLSDPFVVVSKQKADGLLSSKQIYKSPVKEKTLTPIWPAKTAFVIAELNPMNPDHKLTFQVFDKDLLSNDFIGSLDITLTEATQVKGPQVKEIHDKHGALAGTLEFAVSVYVPGTNSTY